MTDTKSIKLYSPADLEDYDHFTPDKVEQKKKGLEVFRDELVQPTKQAIVQSQKPSYISSLWSKIAALFWAPTKQIETATAPKTESEEKIESISRIPVLVPPEDSAVKKNKDNDIGKILKPKNPSAYKSYQMSPEEHLMTIQELMISLVKARMALHEETGKISGERFIKYQEIKKVTRDLIKDLEDKISKDEQYAKYFGKAQVVLGSVALVCSVAAIINPLFGLPAALKVIGALASAIIHGSKSYVKARSNEDSVDLTQRDHSQQKFNQAVSDSMLRMTTSLEGTLKLQGNMIETERLRNEIAGIVLQR
ncbi:MAG: hypothetical protein H0W88_12085 [Parachlamydiaceae bacterium]|nr:hypothetical protein [Parachlamydiaceae bacterium]